MDYENYIELYEAIYFLNRMNHCVENKSSQIINIEEIKKIGITESVYKAIIRILFSNDLLGYDGNNFEIINEEKHRYILENIISKNQNKHYADLFDKAVNASQFFFDHISEAEYEIYSRYNYQITFKTGQKIVEHISFTHKKVLELGGNSGGFGTAILTAYNDCRYTIVDTKIPCDVGNEIKKSNHLNVKFIEGNAFKLMLSDESYDYIVLMNFLHDFDDIKCIDILRNCIKYCDSNTKFLIIEDVLTDEFEPKEVLMHGLRLSVECRGGQQRTIDELKRVFFNINYKLEKTVRLDTVHSMLVWGLCDN